MFRSRTSLFKFLRCRYHSLYSPEFIFSEQNVKRTLAKFSSMKPIRMIVHEPSKRAGVLIPLCISNGKVALLYTLRAASLKSHKGQVSFPGGMQDVIDKNLEETALRETEEELGIARNEIEIWGSGNIIVNRNRISVTPVIGRLKGEIQMDKLQVNSSEVEEVFLVYLEDLCKPDKLEYTQFRSGFASMPVFTGGKLRIWGLTALMTYRFLSSLLPTQGYAHAIKYVTPITSTKNR